MQRAPQPVHLPRWGCDMKPMKFTSPRAARGIQRVLAALSSPMTCNELADALYMDKSMARAYLRYLMMAESRGEQRRIKVVEWRVTSDRGCRRAAVYRRGTGPNLPEPAAQTSADQFRILKANPVKHAKRIADHRRWRQKREGTYTPPPPASPFAALGL